MFNSLFYSLQCLLYKQTLASYCYLHRQKYWAYLLLKMTHYKPPYNSDYPVRSTLSFIHFLAKTKQNYSKIDNILTVLVTVANGSTTRWPKRCHPCRLHYVPHFRLEGNWFHQLKSNWARNFCTLYGCKGALIFYAKLAAQRAKVLATNDKQLSCFFSYL